MKRKAFTLVIMISIILAGHSCRVGESPTKQLVQLQHDIAVRDEEANGLNLDIIEFSWTYRERMDKIHVSGWARNLTGRDIQACRIIMKAFDQDDWPLGIAEDYLQPTYLTPNQKGKFNLYFHEGRRVKNLKIQYYFQTNY